MEKFKVAAANCEDYDSAKIQNAVDVVIEQLGGIEQFVSKDAKVFIKVNLVRDMPPEKCGTTHPEVVIAVINRLKGITDNIIVGDSSGGLYTKGAMNSVYAKCRMTDIEQRTVAKLNQDKIDEVNARLLELIDTQLADARAQLKNVRMLTLAGIITAASIVLESFPIYLLGTSLKIYFSFLVISLGCYVYGPAVGILVGFANDTLGFLISSFGEPYFPGYLITAMLSGLIYGTLLYRQRITVLRLVVVRLIINYGSNVLLGSVWKAMLYGKGYLYYLTSGAIKNTLMLPVEVFLMWAVLNAAVNYGLDRKYIHKR